MAVLLRQADRTDRAFVRELSARVFARFGNYDETLPPLVGLASVHTILAVSGETPVGFAICAFDDPPGADADLVAIAVEPPWQGRGVGRLLLEGAEAIVTGTARGRVAPVLRLSVAVDNAPARRLFERSGYRSVEGATGSYPAGQPSIGMRKTLNGTVSPSRES